MRNLLFLLLLIPLLTSCHSFNNNKNKNETVGTTSTNHQNDAHIKKIVLHHVSLWDIFTPIDVSCDDFDRWFSEYKKKDTITDLSHIAVFESYINNLQKIDSGVNGIDTRAKIYLMSSNNTLLIDYQIVSKSITYIKRCL